MFSPNSISHGAVKLCRSRRGKSKNISIKQRGGTMLPLTVAALYLGHYLSKDVSLVEKVLHFFGYYESNNRHICINSNISMYFR